MSLYEPIDPPDPKDVWTPTMDGHHGYLEADAVDLETAAGHVESSVLYMRELVSG